MPKISNLFDQAVEQFFHELNPYRVGYKNIGITYLAIRQGEIWNITHARISPIQIGRPSRMSNSPDIVVTNKRGDIVVAECTTGLLNKEGKLGNLLARTNEIKRRLEASGHLGIRILPVIVTPKVLDDVKGEIAQANAIGISVATKEDIIAALDQARFNPNPESYFDEAWKALHPPVSSLDVNVPVA